MDFGLSDDRRMLADTLERYLGDNYPLEKRHEYSAQEAGYSREKWQELAELGAVGAMFGESAGGFGGAGPDLMVLFEALGRRLVVEPFLPTLLAGTAIAELACHEHGDLLEAVIGGQAMIALAHGEVDARYELTHVSLAARKTAQGHVLTGRKSVVLGGGSADYLVVTARTGGDIDSADGISAFLVNTSAKGVTRRGYRTVDGYGAAEIELEDTPGILLGGEGEAYAAIEKATAYGLVAICSEALGAMEAAKDLTVEYMHVRKQFGVPIGKFQALQHRMADVLIEIEQMRSTVIGAAGHLDAERGKRERFCAAAKHLAGRIGRQVAEEAIQIHGGMGMTWEYPVGHYAKRIIMIDHLFGDTDHYLERFIATAP